MSNELENNMQNLAISVEEKNLQEEKKQPLFEETSEDEAILVVDASGSTVFTAFGNAKVFDEQLKIAQELKHKYYRIVFFNSENSCDKFPDGTHVLPFVVKKENLKLAFDMIKPSITGSCLTCPHLAFEKMPKAWLKGNPTIYYITDGQLGWNDIARSDLHNIKSKLCTSINIPNARLCILTVEAVHRDYTEVNALRSAAGCDVFQLLAENNMTGMITKFVSRTPKGDFVQINKNRPPAGYIPYESRYFSEFRTAEFIYWMCGEIEKNKDNEMVLLQIAHNLASTLMYLTKDKPKNVVQGLIKTFSSMFPGDKRDILSHTMVHALEKERSGTAGLLADYRAFMRNLFATADAMLKKDVREALDMYENFVGYVINGRVLTGGSRLASNSLTIYGHRYLNCAYEKVPCFPLVKSGALGEINEQCLRQWTRAVYAAIYKVNPLDDEIIYLALANVMIVAKSNVPEVVKNAYRYLGNSMLKKKRQNTNETEIARLLRREAPVPNNGKIEDFFKYLNNAASKLGIEVAHPLKLWYEICGAISVELQTAQSNHFQGHENDEIKFNQVVCDVIPDVLGLEYDCIITLADLSAVGGYRFLSHRSPAGQTCSPNCMLSEEGLKLLLDSRNSVCPVCYAAVNRDTFSAVGPCEKFELNPAYENKYFEGLNAPIQLYNNRNSKPESKNKPAQEGKGTKGTLVILKGTVGSGKSTIAEKIREMVQKRGGTCYVEGPDKYCKTGTPISEGCRLVSEKLAEAVNSEAKDLVVVIDTCGEQTGKNEYTLFGVNFAGWKKVEIYPNFDAKNIRGYLAWSLRNVLRRRKPGVNDNWNLNPESASVKICIDVHLKKSKALGWNAHWNFHGASVDSLRDVAEAYATTLKEPTFNF